MTYLQHTQEHHAPKQHLQVLTLIYNSIANPDAINPTEYLSFSKFLSPADP